MKKHSKSKLPAVPRVDPYLEGLMAKLLDRLGALERKMDTLIGQAKPAQGPEAHQPPRRDRTLYEAICADCHSVCEVPFKPSEDRPVYCKKCFAKRKAGGSGKPFPVLTPVALAPKPASRLAVSQPPASPVLKTAKKSKKNQPAKKAKKKK
ncbi:MAG: CxxC-x17-CxxC domain-containing protein [Candidatus Omnitrophota bacterium]